MNRHEVTTEVLRDKNKLMETSYVRLLLEYDKERRKLKIDKTKAYQKSYSIKTAAKNNWILCIEKSPSVKNYKTYADTVYCCFVFYYSKKGLQVMRQLRNEHALEVFYGHVFTRYNQRMKLNLHNQVDVIKHFFNNNGYTNAEIIEENGRQISVGVCKEGIVLGEHHTNPEWLIHKTFISKDLKRNDQEAKEKELMLDLQIDLISQSAQIIKAINGKQLQALNDVYIQITGNNCLTSSKDKLPIEIPSFKHHPFLTRR